MQRKTEFTELELRDFNERFSKQWVTVDFNSQLIMSKEMCSPFS